MKNDWVLSDLHFELIIFDIYLYFLFVFRDLFGAFSCIRAEVVSSLTTESLLYRNECALEVSP